MDAQRDIRFVEKKVDESWKEQIARDKGLAREPTENQKTEGAHPDPKTKPKTSKELMGLLTSLGYQGMIHLGEVTHPETGEREVQLEAAREVIDLLAALKMKTEGRLSAEEAEVLQSLLPELQMKFAQKT